MDLFQSAQDLANAAKTLVEEGAKSLNDSVEHVRNTATELGASGTAALEQLKATSIELVQQSSKALEETAQSINTTTSEMAASTFAAVEELKQQSDQFAQQGFEKLGEMLDETKATALAIGTSGTVVADALKDLPKMAEELARDMPKIAYRLRHRAGLRVGDAPRSDTDVMALFEKIPGTSKLGASETRIREFLADKHGSHIISRQQGGSNGANNILWEVGADNIRRGARAMTGSEQVYIRFYNAVDSIVKSSGMITQLGMTATGTAILTQTVVTAVSYALDLYRGDITVDEFRERIIEAAVGAGVATPIFFLIFMVVIALFPELALLLSAPAVVAGFNALFGIGVAVPIVQSLIRHIEAGGFGDEITEGYQNLVGDTQQFFPSFTS